MINSLCLEYFVERKKNLLLFLQDQKRSFLFSFFFDEEEEFSQFSLSALVDYIFQIVNYLQIWKDLKYCQLLTGLWQILRVIMSHPSSPAAQSLHWSRNMGKVPKHLYNCTRYRQISQGNTLLAPFECHLLIKGKASEIQKLLMGKRQRGKCCNFMSFALAFEFTQLYMLVLGSFLKCRFGLSLFCKQKDLNKVTQEIFPFKHIFLYMCDFLHERQPYYLLAKA